MIFIYCIVSFTTDLVSKRLAKHIPPFYLYSFFSILEYTLFAIFLFLSFRQKNFRNILLLLSLLFYSIVISNLFRNDAEMQNFDSPSASLEAVLIIVYGIFFLYEQLKDPSVFYIYYLKKFWIILAFLIYFSSTLFLFLYAATFARPEKGTYWIINNIFDIIKNLLFVVSFTLKDKEQRYSSENLYDDM